MCCFEILDELISNYFPKTMAPQVNTSEQTLARFSKNFTIVVPVPSRPQACTLLQQYRNSQEFKHDQNFGSSELLFYLVLKNLTDELRNNPDIKVELAHVSGKAWRSANSEFREAYESLAEDENVK